MRRILPTLVLGVLWVSELELPRVDGHAVVQEAGDFQPRACLVVTTAAPDAIRLPPGQAGVPLPLEDLLNRPGEVLVFASEQARARLHDEEVANATLRTLARHVPPAVPAIVFLSGGQDLSLPAPLLHLGADEVWGKR